MKMPMAWWMVWMAVLGTAAAETTTALQLLDVNIAEHEDTIALWTDHGVRLTLERTTGAGLHVEVGHVTASYLGGSPIRIEEVVEDPQSANLLLDSGPKAWGLPGTSEIDTAHGEPGPWLYLRGADHARAMRTVDLGQSEPRPLVLSGYCQARVKGDGFGWWNRHLALNAQGVYTDGSAMPEVSAYFGQYDHGPQFSRRVICPDKPLAHLDLDLTVPGGDCEAWYRSVELRAARYRIVTPTGPVRRIDGAVIQEFDDEPAALRGIVTYTPTPEYLEVRCDIENVRKDDRALSVYVAVPLDAVGGLWHDHARKTRLVEAGKVYRDTKWYGAGRDGYNNRYPFGGVEAADAEAGLALGVSPAEPRVFQTEYDASRRELRIRFDMGLSPDAGRWANRASCTAYLFAYDVRDGFRGAAARFHRIFDWAFKNRGLAGGTWLAFLTPAAVPGDWRDFHFKFIEATSNIGWENRHGMYSLQYAEPWIHHHEFPEHLGVEEVRGPIEPHAAIATSRRIATQANLPLDVRRMHAAYPGNYIEDKWGEPQGYFFRSASGGRNENMMLVNPNDRLPPTDGAFHSAWTYDLYRVGLGIARQWSIGGWTAIRTSWHPFLSIDREHKVSGTQSVRLDAVEGGTYFEQYLRGIEQIFYLDEAAVPPFTLSYHVRASNIGEEDSRFAWAVTCYYEDGSTTAHSFPVGRPGPEWQSHSVVVAPRERPVAVRVRVATPNAWTPDATVLWVDDVRLLTANGQDLLRNGDFEEAELMPARLSGAYLDTLECYEANLNYRRVHWAYAEEPPTFDSGRAPALHQIYSHITLARHVAEWFHSRGGIVFANCTPVTPFAAPYLDAMGNELNWKQDGRWTPWSDEEANFARFMAATRPYGLLQYADLTVEEEIRYMKRCLFYGFFPSNQASPTGGWYWSDPVVVKRHRPVYAQYVPIIQEVADSGWQPLTLAQTDTPDLWLERFGDGDPVYLTVFNPGSEERSATITLDPRLAASAAAQLWDLLSGQPVTWTTPGASFSVRLGPEDVGVYRVTK